VLVHPPITMPRMDRASSCTFKAGLMSGRLKPSCPPHAGGRSIWAARCCRSVIRCGGGAATADVDLRGGRYRELRKQHDAGSIA